MKIQFIALASCLLLSGMSHIANAAEIYKWTDENGNVHYGEHPPADSAKRLSIKNNSTSEDGKASAASNTAGTDAEQQRNKMIQAMEGDRVEREKKRQKQLKKESQSKQRCAIARDRLVQYQRAGRLYSIDKQGERQYLSDKSRQKEIEQLQAQINKFCK